MPELPEKKQGINKVKYLRRRQKTCENPGTFFPYSNGLCPTLKHPRRVQAASTEKNRANLETYVNALLFHPQFVKEEALLNFFEIKPVQDPGAQQPKPSSPGDDQGSGQPRPAYGSGISEHPSDNNNQEEYTNNSGGSGQGYDNEDDALQAQMESAHINSEGSESQVRGGMSLKQAPLYPVLLCTGAI